ncbi:uncharacterized protein LOC121258442 [Juglans microcarpa x Juglans regia]|uniref:uncharacterized protein LOC121258442 n=1 Tax=Juglans microcarpa x Juglans regia TaxID=2249226 RepID=UPI001B7EB7F0|nr:uncharacterized protein LOC121258442 [Juglans microcarpa x Juglans regia]
MSMMEGSPTTIAPLLLRNLLTSIFIHADNSLLSLSQKYKPLQVIRYTLFSSFLFLSRILPSFFPSLNPFNLEDPFHKPTKKTDNYVPASGAGDSGIARALSQLLSLVNEIPVSSRKYEVVRSLAERLIDENNREGLEALREVNRTALSSAFARTLGQLEAALVDGGQERAGSDGGSMSGRVEHRVSRVLRAVRVLGNVVRSRAGRSTEEMSGSDTSAEKLAAELLWLAQKLAACGCAEEAVRRWASAPNLAWLALWAEPRLQGSLVKISAFLFEQVKDLEVDETEEVKKEQQRQTKMMMLMSWLPLLCRASNGTDVPVLSIRERAELEIVLEETIELLEQQEQEQVFSLWLHHFTRCPSSDWPNLHASYTRWCNASRRLLVIQ